jgi:hypothetical protein
MNHRSPALRRSANGEACVSCGRNDGTTVWAHSNSQEHGKGMSIKAHDLLGLYLCGDCHALYDRSPLLTREEKRRMFRNCYPRTMVRVAEKIAAGELKL